MPGRSRSAILRAQAWLLSLVIIIAALPDSATGRSVQDTVVIRGDPQCSGCAIRVERIARLGRIDDETGPADAVWLARDSQGAFYVSPTVSHDGFLRFGVDGRFDRVIGRRGRGPGEFAAAGEILMMPGDTIIVFDRVDQSRSVFAPDGTFIERDRVGVQTDGIIPLPDGSMVVQGERPTPGGIGRPAHLVSRDGSVVRSFGAYDTVVVRGMRLMHIRRIGAASDNAVWLGRLEEYAIDRWTVEGVHQLTLVREVSWYPSWRVEDLRGAMQYERPKPMLAGVWQDRDGILWTAARVAASDWVSEGDPGGRNPPLPSKDEQAGYFDTIIEAIDLQSMRVLASLRLPHTYMQRMGGPGLLVMRSGDGSGLVYVDVLEVRLAGWSPGDGIARRRADHARH